MQGSGASARSSTTPASSSPSPFTQYTEADCAAMLGFPRKTPHSCPRGRQQ
jgi:hypothetical protein